MFLAANAAAFLSPYVYPLALVLDPGALAMDGVLTETLFDLPLIKDIFDVTIYLN